MDCGAPGGSSLAFLAQALRFIGKGKTMAILSQAPIS